MRLTLVLLITFVINLILSAHTHLASGGALLALFVYFGLLSLLTALTHVANLDRVDVAEALTDDMYPTQLQVPLRVEFAPYIVTWLAFWIVSELFHAAQLLFTSLPLFFYALYAALALYGVYQVLLPPGSTRARLVLLALQLVTVTLFFYPTRHWAPQQQSAVIVTLRVLLYFGIVWFLDFVRPAQAFKLLDTRRREVQKRVDDVARDIDPSSFELPRTRNTHIVGLGARFEHNSGSRREQIAQIIAAYENVGYEHERAFEIALVSAWLLVTPVVVAFVGAVGVLVVTFLSQSRRSNAAPPHDRARSDATPLPEAQPLPKPQRQQPVPQQQQQRSVRQTIGGGSRREATPSPPPPRPRQLPIVQPTPFVPLQSTAVVEQEHVEQWNSHVDDSNVAEQPESDSDDGEIRVIVFD